MYYLFRLKVLILVVFYIIYLLSNVWNWGFLSLKVMLFILVFVIVENVVFFIKVFIMVFMVFIKSVLWVRDIYIVVDNC